MSLNVEVVSGSQVDELVPRHPNVNLRIVRDLPRNVEVVSRSKVNIIVPRHQHFNLRIVRDLSLNIEVALRALAFIRIVRESSLLTTYWSKPTSSS